MYRFLSRFPYSRGYWWYQYTVNLLISKFLCLIFGEKYKHKKTLPFFRTTEIVYSMIHCLFLNFLMAPVILIGILKTLFVITIALLKMSWSIYQVPLGFPWICAFKDKWENFINKIYKHRICRKNKTLGKILKFKRDSSMRYLRMSGFFHVIFRVTIPGK